MYCLLAWLNSDCFAREGVTASAACVLIAIFAVFPLADTVLIELVSIINLQQQGDPNKDQVKSILHKHEQNTLSTFVAF